MKKVFFCFTVLMLCISASAQTKQEVQKVQGKQEADSTRTPLGWYFGVSAGPQVFTGMTDKYLPLKEALAPVGGIYVGRYLNDWFKIDINLTAARFKGIYARPSREIHFATDNCFDLNSQRYYQDGCYLQLYARAGFDLNTLLAGYKEDRKLSFAPYFGGGIASGLGESFTDVSNVAIAPTIDYGMEVLLRLGNACTGIIDIHGNAVGMQLENEGCTTHTFHASYGAKLGLRFDLGN